MFASSNVWAYSAGIAAGVSSMLVYGRVSPQEKLKSLSSAVAALKQQIAGYDGDFSGAMALTKQNLRLSCRRLGVVILPSLVAGLPVIVGLLMVGQQYVAYFLATFVAAFATKALFKIA